MRGGGEPEGRFRSGAQRNSPQLVLEPQGPCSRLLRTGLVTYFTTQMILTWRNWAPNALSRWLWWKKPTLEWQQHDNVGRGDGVRQELG